MRWGDGVGGCACSRGGRSYEEDDDEEEEEEEEEGRKTAIDSYNNNIRYLSFLLQIFVYSLNSSHCDIICISRPSYYIFFALKIRVL